MKGRPWYSGKVVGGPADGSSLGHGRPEVWLAGPPPARYTWNGEAWVFSPPGPDEKRGDRDRRESLR